MEGAQGEGNGEDGCDVSVGVMDGKGYGLRRDREREIKWRKRCNPAHVMAGGTREKFHLQGHSGPPLWRLEVVLALFWVFFFNICTVWHSNLLQQTVIVLK